MVYVTRRADRLLMLGADFDSDSTGSLIVESTDDVLEAFVPSVDTQANVAVLVLFCWLILVDVFVTNHVNTMTYDCVVVGFASVFRIFHNTISNHAGLNVGALATGVIDQDWVNVGAHTNTTPAGMVSLSVALFIFSLSRTGMTIRYVTYSPIVRSLFNVSG